MPTFALVVTLCLIFASCDSGGGGSGGNGGDGETYDIVEVSYPAGSAFIPYDNPVIRVTADNPTVTLTGLTGQNVFLVKANPSAYSADEFMTGMVSSFTVNDVTYTASGSKQTVSQSAFPQYSNREAFTSRAGAVKRAVSGKMGGITRVDHEAARKLGASELPSRTTRPGSAGSSPARSVVPVYSVTGDTKTFYVQDGDGNWFGISAVLRAVGEHCYIWVPSENYSASSAANDDNKISQNQASVLCNKFEAMYSLVTNLFGYEFGGGLEETDENYGGVDSDPRISVLVYDIGEDYTPTQDSGILGFFWGKDYYSQEDIDNHPEVFGSGVKTNLAEIFYVDSHFTDYAPDFIYSTLIHEYQHMINFARKSLPSNANPQGLMVDVWFNEMLSMLSEDAVGPKIGINSKIYPLNSRMPLFLGDYSFSGVTDWLGGDAVYSSYASAYAFGAYLARNYGGAALVKTLLDCNYANREAVGYAIQSLDSGFPDMADTASKDTSGFDIAFRKYAEAMIFSGQSVDSAYSPASFDRLVSNGVYTFYSFDIWELTNYYAGTMGVSSDYTGPLVWALGGYPLRPYGLDLQTNEHWQGVNGTLEINFVMPVSNSVELYVMVR